MSEATVVARRKVPARRRATATAAKPPAKRGITEVDGGLFNFPNRPVALGIDQSFGGFGVTALALSGEPLFHSWCFKAPGHGVTRLQSVDFFLYSILEQLTGERCFVKRVAMEGYAFGSQMANMAGELGAVVKMCLAGYFGVEGDTAGLPLIVPPTSLKKYAVGKGTKVAKQHILLGVYKKWGVEYRDDNMADAYVLARIARERDTTEGLLAYELDVLEKLRDPKHRDREEIA